MPPDFSPAIPRAKPARRVAANPRPFPSHRFRRTAHRAIIAAIHFRPTVPPAMATMFKVKYGTPHPIPVDCATPTYLERDVDGDEILSNTHFHSEDEAWDTLLREHDAGQCLAVRNVQQLRDQLAAAEKALCDAAILATAARTAFEART